MLLAGTSCFVLDPDGIASRYLGGLSEHPGDRQSENTHLASCRTPESQGQADNGRGQPSTLSSKKTHDVGVAIGCLFGL